MCCFPAPITDIMEWRRRQRGEQQFSASSVLFKYSVCNEKVNHCPSAGVSVSRAVLTGLKQRGDTWHLKISSAEPSPEGFSYQSSAGQTGWPLMTAGVCVCVTLMAEQNHILTGSRCVSDTVILPGDSQTQIIGGIDWLPEPLQWRPMSLIHMENNRVFDCNSTPADCSGSRARALFH